MMPLLILAWLYPAFSGFSQNEASEARVQVWAVPAVQKVRPDDRRESSNLVWDQKTRTVSLSGAKNEHVPFQIVISTPPPPTRYDKPAGGFFVQASDLRSAGGTIPGERLRLFFEHVVLCYAPSSPVGAAGFWPDALAPLTDPFGMDAQFRQSVRNRVVWVDVFVPRDAAAGEYRGVLKITQDGAPIDEIGLVLKVFDFALPDETHLLAYMGVSGRQIARSHELPPSSRELKALLRKYYDFLYAGRMEPWFNELLHPEVVETAGGEIRVEFDQAEYDDFLNTRKTRRVVLEAAPSRLRNDPRHPPFSEGFNRRVGSYLRQVSEFFRKNGWKDRLVFNSPIDEPNTQEQYADTRRWAELVHAAAPGIPFLVTESPVPDNPAWGRLTGFADHFSVHGNALNQAAVRKASAEEQAKGGEITWYISCDQVYPQPNYFIDAPAMDPVMVPWITWRHGLNGILYWSINYWPQTPDPWLDPVTFLSGFFCSRGSVLNGEGSLVYPGSRTKQYTGQRDVDGPVSSIRFELLREGIEDYEYLWLLKSLGDGAFADEAAREMVVDVRAFSRSVEKLFELRERMAARIEGLSRRR